MLFLARIAFHKVPNLFFKNILLGKINILPCLFELTQSYCYKVMIDKINRNLKLFFFLSRDCESLKVLAGDKL